MGASRNNGERVEDQGSVMMLVLFAEMVEAPASDDLRARMTSLTQVLGNDYNTLGRSNKMDLLSN